MIWITIKSRKKLSSRIAKKNTSNIPIICNLGSSLLPTITTNSTSSEMKMAGWKDRYHSWKWKPETSRNKWPKPKDKPIAKNTIKMRSKDSWSKCRTKSTNSTSSSNEKTKPSSSSKPISKNFKPKFLVSAHPQANPNRNQALLPSPGPNNACGRSRNPRATAGRISSSGSYKTDWKANRNNCKLWWQKQIN